MKSTLLSDNWTFETPEDPPYPTNFVPRIGTYPAAVPGAVHLDLMAAGLIPDPFRACYERDVAWVDERTWIYKTQFQWKPSPDLPNQVIVFEGLDTICTILLNGAALAVSDNMFVPLETAVTGRLEKGANALEIRFEPALTAGRQRRAAYFEQEGIPNQTPNFEDRAFVRKAQYMYGWDWGPRLISCGIWRPIRLLEYRERIRSASFMQERLPNGKFRIWVDTDIEGETKPSASFGGLKRTPGEPLEFEVEPDLWWPNGEGAQTLHRATLSLGSEDNLEQQIGLRTVVLHQEEDSHGRSFEFEVNGRPLWARGANWIPNDSFVARDTEVPTQIERCAKLNMNMLRVWGGGFYESDAFYDGCDRHGILVWQDFPFACSYYPDGAEGQAQAEQEAAWQINRLRDRASLAIWCGNNENLAMFEDNWGGRDRRPKRYYGERIYSETLPAVLAKLDPHRPYISTSPLEPLHDNIGDSHYWDVWHGRGDWKFYLESKSRFTSEFGFASSCSLDCWLHDVTVEPDLPSRNIVDWHDKTGKGSETFLSFVKLHYPDPKNLEDWVYYSQLNQRDALRCGIEHFRRTPACRGALIWQFNDCWPVQSWAVQDYRRLLKPAGFELHRLYQPVLISIEQLPGKALVHVANDGQNLLKGDLIAEMVCTQSGDVVAREHGAVLLDPNERGVVIEASLQGHDLASTALRAYFAGLEEPVVWQLLTEPKETRFGKPKIDWETKEDRLHLSVAGFVRDLVAWDPSDAFNLRDLHTDQPGWKALTLANEDAVFSVRSHPSDLRYRYLGCS